MNSRDQLIELRRLIRNGSSPREIIPWLTTTTLREAGWTVNRDTDTFLSATNRDGTLQIAVSKTNQAIGATRTTPSTKGAPGFIANAKEAMERLLWSGVPNPPQVNVRTTRECSWAEALETI